MEFDSRVTQFEIKTRCLPAKKLGNSLLFVHLLSSYTKSPAFLR